MSRVGQGRCEHSGDGPALLLGVTGEHGRAAGSVPDPSFSEYLLLSTFLPSPYGSGLGPGSLLVLAVP